MKGGLVGVVAVVEESLGTGRSGSNRGQCGQPRVFSWEARANRGRWMVEAIRINWRGRWADGLTGGGCPAGAG